MLGLIESRMERVEEGIRPNKMSILHFIWIVLIQFIRNKKYLQLIKIKKKQKAVVLSWV